MKKYEIFDHTADIGITAFGRNVKELFSHAAEGMFSIIADLKMVKAVSSLEITVEAFDREDLLVRWLSELLFLFDTRGFLGTTFSIAEMSDVSLRATATGEILDTTRHILNNEIKAVTYHGLKITQNKNSLWQATVLFDI